MWDRHIAVWASEVTNNLPYPSSLIVFIENYITRLSDWYRGLLWVLLFFTEGLQRNQENRKLNKTLHTFLHAVHFKHLSEGDVNGIYEYFKVKVILKLGHASNLLIFLQKCEKLVAFV